MNDRILVLNYKKIEENGPVVYWMSRDQRATSNWALSYAQQIAIEHKVPLVVLFVVQENFLDAQKRQYDFMVNGL
jgi:deoxyribodipyrimidine photo-lyase